MIIEDLIMNLTLIELLINVPIIKVDSDDVESYALSIIQDKKSPNLIFLGTDDGLYVSIDNADSWKKWTNGFPTVPVKDLVIQERENDLVIGTFGRAAWVLDDIRPLRVLVLFQLILLLNYLNHQHQY